MIASKSQCTTLYSEESGQNPMCGFSTPGHRPLKWLYLADPTGEVALLTPDFVHSQGTLCTARALCAQPGH